jgi:hypothetical protein
LGVLFIAQIYGNYRNFELFAAGEVEKIYFIADIRNAMARRTAKIGFLMKKNRRFGRYAGHHHQHFSFPGLEK